MPYASRMSLGDRGQYTGRQTQPSRLLFNSRPHSLELGRGHCTNPLVDQDIDILDSFLRDSPRQGRHLLMVNDLCGSGDLMLRGWEASSGMRFGPRGQG